jgi:phenylacetate-coenzyme A ligase PaaK-like adenylate-forming protein
MALRLRKGEFFDELETMSPAARREYLDRKLAATVAYAYKHAPAVKKLLDNAGVGPEQIRYVK